MKHIPVVLCLAIILGFPAARADAATITFDSGVPAGITLGGDMTWDSRGGGHIYMEQYFSDDYILFSAPTTVNSFQMNLSPWEDYTGTTARTTYPVSIAAFDSGNNQLWATTVDLAGYLAWNQWLTVNVNVANVSKLQFSATNDAYWPSIDNLVIGEAVVAPEPASMLLLGTGLLGAGVRRWRQKRA